MRHITLVTTLALLVVSSSAQNDKTALKAELKILNERVLSSLVKTSSSVSGPDRTGEFRSSSSDRKLAKFSGCKLSFSGSQRDHQASDNYYWNVSVPLKYLDLSRSSIRRDRSGISLDLITIGTKISRRSLFSGKSSIDLRERQSSTTSFTNRYRGWVGTDWDPELLAKDLLRAAEICKLL